MEVVGHGDYGGGFIVVYVWRTLVWSLAYRGNQEHKRLPETFQAAFYFEDKAAVRWRSQSVRFGQTHRLAWV